MSDNKTITFDKMRPLTRIIFLCDLGLVFALPWIFVNLLFRMPNLMWAIFAAYGLALAALRIGLWSLDRRARAESQEREPTKAQDLFSN
jgi:hypothetical protein